MAEDRFEKIKKEIVNPLYSEAGGALFDCQEFEFSIAYLLYHLSRIGVIGLDVDKINSIMDDETKKTAGQLARMLKDSVNLSPDLESTIEIALEARNSIIHRFLVDNIERLVEPVERELLLKEIRAIRHKVKTGSMALKPYIVYFMKTIDGVELDSEKTQAKFKFLESTNSTDNGVVH